MDFSIGIPHGGMSLLQVHDYYTRIEGFDIPNWELIVVGPAIPDLDNDLYPNLKVIEFDELLNGKPWITKKKNIITQSALYENIVYVHDYLTLDEGWYDGWKTFDEPFDVAVNMILIKEHGSIYRHSDWVIEPYFVWELHPDWHGKFWDLSLDYGVKDLTSLQYISGNYWVAKKSFMEQYPLNESLEWGKEEDLEWSRRIRHLTKFKINTNSITWLNKPGKWKPGMLDSVLINELRVKHSL